MSEPATTSVCGDAGRLTGSLKTLFGVGTLSGLTDGQLLERFLRGRGGDATADAEAAFAVLVERHGAMVLSVCRAVLGDRHDAEDAGQAAFLVLARRAGTIRKGESVASWLYGAARRIAARARRDLARRRELERRRLAMTPPTEPVASAPAEPCPELYEELDGIPDPFRAAIVLCDLEGQTYEQAAGLLGCPVGTLQSRLARGRERLRRRLERRGIAPAVVGIGSGLGPTAALSPQLTAAIVREAVRTIGGGTIAGAAPAAVTTLAGAEIRRQTMNRLVTMLASLLMAGLTATAAIGLAAVGREDDPRVQPPATVGRKAEAGPIHVRVVDLKGKDAAGVAVQVRSWDQRARSFATDADGRATIPREVLGEWSSLIARGGEGSLAWSPPRDADARPNRPAGTEDEPIVMRLLPLNHRVEGSVVDLAGKPISGVALWVDSLDESTNGWVNLSETTLEPLLTPPLTDRFGRFVMMLPQEARIGLRAQHPRFIGHRILVDQEDRSLPSAVLIPAGGITGRVTDAATDKPVAGAVVFAQLIESHLQIFGGSGDARSDEQGRFTLDGLAPGVYNLILSKAPGRPHATARAIEGVRVRAGADTPANLAVMEGRPLRIAVVDRITGQPVPGIPVGCHGTARPRSGATVLMSKTDEQGLLTFHVPPGEQYLYLADGSENQRLAHRVVVVPDRGEIELVRLMRWIKPARKPMLDAMKAAVPQPVEPAKAVAAGDEPAAGKAAVRAEPSNRTSEVELAKVQEEAKPPPLEIRTTTRTVFGNGDGDIPVKAPAPGARTVVGHVRDSQGRPLSGIHLGIAGTAESVATDRDGMFELADVPRGDLRVYLQRRHGKFQFETIAADRDRVEITLRPEIEAQADDQPGPLRDEPIPPGLRDRLTFVDLEPQGTDYLSDGPDGDGNDLNRLPRGVHKLGETYFRVGEKMVHLQGRERPDLPRSVKGIAVRARGRVLHFLHSTQGGVDMEDKIAGVYVIRYADGSIEQAPVVYSRDLSNWWHRDPGRRVTRAKVAWTGLNDKLEQHPRPGLMVRLYDMAWTNPHPEKMIATVDFLSAGQECDPFLVATTVERDR